VAVADWRARSGPPPQLSAQPYTPYAAPYAEPNGHPQADYARAMAIANGNPGAPQTALSPAPSAAPLPQGPTEADTAQAPPTPQ